MRGTFAVGLLAAALSGGAALAQEGPTLSIGDPVPAIDIEYFFQGKPVPAFDREKTYVLEFWATW